MGFWCLNMANWVRYPLPPFLSVSPLESIRSGGAIPPPLKRGISAILARDPMKTRQMGAIPPFAILSRKGIARYGGVSRTGPLREGEGGGAEGLEGVWREFFKEGWAFFFLFGAEVPTLADVSDIFIFFRLGEGEGGVRGRREGGVVDFLLKIPEGGGVSRRRGRGAGRVSAANWGFWGGGG